MKIFTDPYKPAVTYTGTKSWYIYFHYRHPHTGKWQMFKDRGGLNYKELRNHPAQRKKAARNLKATA